MSKLIQFCVLVSVLFLFSAIWRPSFDTRYPNVGDYTGAVVGGNANTIDVTSTRRVPYLDLPPSTKEVVINIGTNVDPILPREASGPCAMTIAFEPIVPELIPHHPQLMVVPAAVSDASTSISTMYVYNTMGVSSSLSKPASESFWNQGGFNMGAKLVPIVSIQDVLLSIPSNVTIDFLQTDAQGHDFSIIQAGMPYLLQRKVEFLRTETYLDRIVTYEGVQNDLCVHWLPFMTANGYSLVGITLAENGYLAFQPAQRVIQACNGISRSDRGLHEKQSSSLSISEMNFTAGLREADTMWRLNLPNRDGSTVPVGESRFDYPVLGGTGKIAPPSFTKADYQKCS